MARIKCRLVCHSIASHLSQLYTGFLMLHRDGFIDLSQIIQPQNIRGVKAHLSVVINESLRLHYDVHDSAKINEEYLNASDYYFKRSYSRVYIDGIGNQRYKIFPLGLTYELYPSNVDLLRLQRTLILATGKNKIEEAIRSLKLDTWLQKPSFTPRVHNMQSLPDYELPPKILFMVRAWDPYDDPDRAPEMIEEWRQINETRAECIRLLRETFGQNFYGGFSHTDFAMKNYGQFLVSNNVFTSKKNYIRQLRNYPICVATTGLHGSIGAKFGEYIAFSRSILSERLNNEVPGLKEGKHYLEFDSPNECVEKAKLLFSDRNLRNFIMTNNAKYYFSYLRPDLLILNTILIALSGKQNKDEL